jgi:hypothetical protein
MSQPEKEWLRSERWKKFKLILSNNVVREKVFLFVLLLPLFFERECLQVIIGRKKVGIKI